LIDGEDQDASLLSDNNNNDEKLDLKSVPNCKTNNSMPLA
jgi:hypothetical protein